MLDGSSLVNLSEKVAVNSKLRLRRRLSEASTKVIKEQSEPGYDAQRVAEEIGAHSAAYLGKLEAAQAASVFILNLESYRG